MFSIRKKSPPSQDKRRAFSKLLASHQDQILAVSTRLLRNRENAMDILQEVAIKMYQHWEELDTNQNIDGWLYRVTVNECYRWLRKQPPISQLGEDMSLESLQEVAPQQENELTTKQFQAFLSRALARLSEQERMAFVLRDLEQRSGKEIASMMRCQATTARGYYFAARKKLASYIKTNAPEWLESKEAVS